MLWLNMLVVLLDVEAVVVVDVTSVMTTGEEVVVDEDIKTVVVMVAAVAGVVGMRADVEGAAVVVGDMVDGTVIGPGK